MLSQLKYGLETKLRPDFKYSPSLTIFIVIAFLLCWSTLYLRVFIDMDMSWLLQCLERFLAGGTYTTDYYESNPPLSFWIYLPAFPLYTYLGFDPKVAVFITMLIYLGIANLTLLSLLRKETTVSPRDTLVIMSALLMAQSWAVGDIFGSKDHLIAVFLLPLSLYQYQRTRDMAHSKILTLSSIIMGGIAICLKPHYAIIPTLCFAHRLYTTCSLRKCVFAADFWGMLLIGIIYIVAIWLLAPEFFILLPEIISLYNIQAPYFLYERYHYLLYAACAAIGVYFLFSEEKQKNLRNSVYTLATLSAICLIPYMLQFKGYHYHALPLLIYGAAACFIMIYGMIRELTKCKSDIALWGACTAMVIIFGGYTYGNKAPKLTKEELLALPIVQTIEEHAWNGTYTSMYKLHNLASLPHISSLKSGTRFGALWPITGLTRFANQEKDPELRNTYKNEIYRYVGMMAEDIKRYKPSVILIPQYPDPKTLKPNKDYYNFLIKHEVFKQNMRNYTFYDTITFDTTFTHGSENTDPAKLVPHDVYVLNHDNAL